ncbi:MAG: DNA repair ATPase [Ferruginibacter sp.]|nr:DNA repair ATPase [Cytophagales bacterium]
MAETAHPLPPPSEPQLEAGTYEIIRKRLDSHGKDLRERLEKLNLARKAVFGTVTTQLVANNRITTEHNCIPRDMIPVGNQFIFGYNVHLGLKSEVEPSDVFSVYEYQATDHSFSPKPPDLIRNAEFETLLKELYKYYKYAAFHRFVLLGPHLFMVFQIGKSAKDIKTFKWLVKEDGAGGLHYLDNRSDHEYTFPPQHEFEWKRTRRDYQRKGKHPHVSVEDRLFVETIGGDLTIKVEDNTDSGEGIFSEKVEQAEQTLDDAEFHYASLGNLVLLKIKPYQENAYRYLIYNDKLKKVVRVDAIQDACVLLPDGQGLIFSNGYYLQSGELKQFDNLLERMRFEKRIPSPNGEDFLYVFYNDALSTYILLSYNLIEQRVENPLVCNGFSLFANGELAYFKATGEPARNHTIQIWQTPYVQADWAPPVEQKSYLYKIGNKDIVRAMAEGNDVLNLIGRPDVYASLYLDLVKKTGAILDAYYWLNQPEAFQPALPLTEIRTAATGAIDEFEKVTRVRQNTQRQTEATAKKVGELREYAKKAVFENIDQYVRLLADLRSWRGAVISLREMRYADLALAESLETSLEEQTKLSSEACVAFLLREDSLDFYRGKVESGRQAIGTVEKVADVSSIEQQTDAVGKELELLIEIVSNLKIADSTQTTRIIDAISVVYAGLNQVKANLKAKRKELSGVEATAEFNAQNKLLGQTLINYLNVCETPRACDDYLTKLMVQVEELEGRFADFDEFTGQLADKREELHHAFEAKKLLLTEARNQKAIRLVAAADRILKGIGSRVAVFKAVNEINGYFAADLMIGKIRDLVDQLVAMDETVKADDIQSRLKTIREDAVRQLKDRQELFVDGQNVIRLGKHAFTVNVQNLDLTILRKDAGGQPGEMQYHLTGTNFFEPITDPAFLATREAWTQELVSENAQVYRAEYLAYQLYKTLTTSQRLPGERLMGETQTPTAPTLPSPQSGEGASFLSQVQQFMAPRYGEGYVKGVHDHDAARLLEALLELHQRIDLLRYESDARACAAFYWNHVVDGETRENLRVRLKGIGLIRQAFPEPQDFGEVLAPIRAGVMEFLQRTGLFSPALVAPASAYLFDELTRSDAFIISRPAADAHQDFLDHLTKNRLRELFDASLEKLGEPIERFAMTRHWVKAFAGQTRPDALAYVDEAALLLLEGSFEAGRVVQAVTQRELTNLYGAHPVIENKTYQLDYNAFVRKMAAFEQTVVPRYQHYVALKKALAEAFRAELRLDEFRPRVLTSFVRNKLVDQLYLPLVGDNLAKQIGVAGEGKRTDLMGMLLLVSPPGYGKTTLMEYVANRLGLIFMKVNGPAIGHRVTSLDPAEAPNASAREELNKLNLAFEMGDNVMIYVDDIQHCNPEFLQKFISLCDGQRKIEGTYKGKSKTYDLRGKKVCVVMAGNPYTESGDKFQIPDMLANRADTYNLGDIIGDTEDIFKLSYLENCLTANPTLNTLATRSQPDIHALIRLAETGSREGVAFEANYSAEEVNEYVAVLKKLTTVRDVILRNNLAYIHSAAQSDEFRTEPPFKLQGSYRNMNKIAARVAPIMNEAELQTLILAHYENEAQTLTTGAEANLLKFKELNGLLSETERQRWEDIKATFRRNQRFKGLGTTDQMGQLLVQLSSFGEGLGAIKDVIAAGLKNGKG